LNRAAETNPVAMRKMAEKLEHVEPDDREEFSALTDQLAANAAQLATVKAKRRSDEMARTARKPVVKQSARQTGKPARSATKPPVEAADQSPTSRRVP
jgi:hypothetical protein